MYIKFNAAEKMTIGVELEIQTISPRTGELVPGSGVILSQLAGEVRFKPELFNSTLEINTEICESLPELEYSLKKSLATIHEIAAWNDLEILISGCHPFSNWQQQQITQQERYLNLLHRIQWPVRQFLIFGLHIHVGIDNADKVIYVMNRLTSYIPHLIALSASSPFWNGFDTGLATSRVKIFEELPNAGLPYYFKNWEKYSELVSRLIKTNSIDTVRDIWWDIRPHPIFGTVEVRVCDAMPTLKENMALSAMVFLLAAKFASEFESDGDTPMIDRWILEENKWRAARYGLSGKIIMNDAGETQTLGDAIRRLHTELLDYARTAGFTDIEPYLSTIPEILKRGPSYARQRHWARQKPGDYKFIVNNLLRETRENKLLNGF